MGPMSYEGPEKYIFISYAHKDSDRVLRILEKMTEAGYRIWYDDGIAPGSEWPEDIAAHLDGCAVFLAFVSNISATKAENVEIRFAENVSKAMNVTTKEEVGLRFDLEGYDYKILFVE